MSDVNEVKRYFIETVIGNSCVVYEELVDGLDNYTEMVTASDHDRIVTELTNRLYEYNKETSELEAELANRDANERSWLVAKEIEIGAMFAGQLSEMQETIARQARVIAQLRVQRNIYHKIAVKWGSAQTTLEELDRRVLVAEKGDEP